ncbi:MAG: hypothetical protein V3W09_04090 [Nitrososphaerales archaeon]
MAEPQGTTVNPAVLQAASGQGQPQAQSQGQTQARSTGPTNVTPLEAIGSFIPLIGPIIAAVASNRIRGARQALDFNIEALNSLAETAQLNEENIAGFKKAGVPKEIIEGALQKSKARAADPNVQAKRQVIQAALGIMNRPVGIDFTPFPPQVQGEIQARQAQPGAAQPIVPELPQPTREPVGEERLTRLESLIRERPAALAVSPTLRPGVEAAGDVSRELSNLSEVQAAFVLRSTKLRPGQTIADIDEEQREDMLQAIKDTKSGITINIPPAPPAGILRDIREGKSSLDRLSNIEQTFNKAFVGPLQGRGLRLGITANLASQEAADFVSDVDALGRDLRRFFFGTAVSGVEQRSALRSIPAVEQSDVQFKGNIRATRREVESRLKRTEEVIARFGFRGGTRGQPLSLPDRIKTTSQAIKFLMQPPRSFSEAEAREWLKENETAE